MAEGGMQPSSIVHINLPCPDLTAGQEFYGRLFGWRFIPNSESYVLFDDGGLGGGLTSAASPAASGGVTVFIQVEDIDAKLSEVEAAGGQTVRPRGPVGGPGFYGIFSDPWGNQIGLYSVK